MLSRWSVAVAVFGGACNLLIVILTLYQDESLQHIRPNEWRSIIGVTATTWAPSLVLLAFRHYLAGYPHLRIYALFDFGLANRIPPSILC